MGFISLVLNNMLFYLPLLYNDIKLNKTAVDKGLPLIPVVGTFTGITPLVFVLWLLFYFKYLL